MDDRKMILREKILLILSGAAAAVMVVPAWIPGICCALVGCAVWALAVWRSPLPGGNICGVLRSPGVLLAGLIFAIGYGCNFYNDWGSSHILCLAAEKMGVSSGTLGVLLAVILAAVSLPAVVCVISYFWMEARDSFHEHSVSTEEKGIPFQGAIALLFVCYLVGIASILRANFFYYDDAGRAVFGYKQWDYFGRFLSTAFSTVIHTDNYLADISPLPQLLSVLIMAVSGALILYILFDRTRFSLWEIAAVIPLGLNPYFLGCISYRFDAPYMAASVFCGIFPLLFWNKKTASYLFISALGMIGVCTSYQPSTGVFPMLAVLLGLRMLNRGASRKETAAFLLKSVGGYLVGLMIFKLALMRPASAGYVSNALPGVTELIPHAFSNLKKYYSLVLEDFRPLWRILSALSIVCFLVVTAKRSKRARIFGACSGAVALVLMMVMCFGLYPVLSDTLFAPRAMYGFGILLTILCVSIAEGLGNAAEKMVAVALSWCFFVFSFTYGNALNLQREYTDFRMQMVVQDLNTCISEWPEETVSLRVSGRIGRSPLIDNMGGGGDMLARLIPETFDGSMDLTRVLFYNQYGLSEHVRDDSEENDSGEYPVLKDGVYHTISGDETHIVVTLK